jgi:hypothetical protein
MFLEAIRRNEEFKIDTDLAFTEFWKREGESLQNRQMNEIDEDGNIISSTLLEEPIKELELNPYVLNAYCYSQEAIQVCKKYGLLYPYHYNQPGIHSLGPNQEMVFSAIHSVESVSVINGEEVRLFRSPCLKALKKALDYLDIRVNLHWPKQEIMKIFEMVLDNALQEKGLIGEKVKKRGAAFDPLPFKVWDMHIRDGKPLPEIARELFPEIKGSSSADGIFRSNLRVVERAYEKAVLQISSISPTV